MSDDTSAFCEAWNAALRSGDDSALKDILADVPAELEDEAAVVREDDSNGPQSAEEEAAAAEILDWTELHCQRGEPGDSRRRVAPPVDAEFDGLSFCGTLGLPPSPADDRSGMVIYADAGADDPYRGPMLGLLWDPSGGGDHSGDGRAQAVSVRGQSGLAAPITVFQQTILPELGTVIAWTEGDRDFGLYGRHWPIGRAAELVEVADQLEESDSGFHIPDEALPDGFGEVVSSNPSVISLVFVSSALYSLHYQGAGGASRRGSLAVHGLQMTEDEFQAFRFFTIGVEKDDVAGREGLVGNAWSEDGPAVVTWREHDGLVVRIVGIGVPLEAARKVAEESRELTKEEWTAVVEADSQCPERRPDRPPPRPGGSPEPTQLN